MRKILSLFCMFAILPLSAQTDRFSITLKVDSAIAKNISGSLLIDRMKELIAKEKEQ